MSWSLPITPQRSGEPLTAAQLAAGMEPQPASDPRPWLAARITACRACEHVANGGQACAACDLRCAHPLAKEKPPLLANPESDCPKHLWS